MTIAYSTEPMNLDPYLNTAFIARWQANLVHDYLWENNKGSESEYIPNLAESWEWVDTLTFKIKLQEGVLFSNGRELEGKDVKFSIERILDPNTGSPRQGVYSPIDNIEIVDKYTVVINLSEPFPSLMPFLRMEVIIPEEAVPTIGTEPFGCGPWIFKTWDQGLQLIFERNPNYWKNPLPYLDELVIKYMPDYPARRVALAAGDVDMIDWMDSADYESLKNEANITVLPGLFKVIQYAAFNTQKPPLDNKILRQAIAMAIDREEIAEVYLYGLAPVTYAPMSSESPFYNLDWELDQGPNIERAKELLAEAGYPDGEGLPTIELSGSIGPEEPIGIAIQDQLKAIGVDAEIRTLEGAAALDYWAVKMSHDIAYLGDLFEDTDPTFIFQNYFSGNGGLNGINGFWTTPEIGDLLAELKSSTDTNKQKDLVNQIMEIFYDESPMIFTCLDLKFQAYANYVKDYYMYRSSQPDYDEVWLDK